MNLWRNLSLTLFTLVIGLMATIGEAKIKVFTTTTNLEDVVRQVGGEGVDVEAFCQGTQDPHYLEAKPSYTYRLAKADLLVSIGADLEVGWLPLIIRSSRKPSLREGQSGHLVASASLDLLDKDPENLSRAQGDVHPDGNPHFMLSPFKALEVATKVKDKLSELDPSRKKQYQERYEEFKAKLLGNIKTWKKKLGNGVKVITYHETLTYFYQDFGIKNIDVLEPKPGIPPSASHILGVIEKIKKEKVKKIIIENYYDDAIAKRIKKEVPHVDIVVVPVAVRGNDQVPDLISLYGYLTKHIGDQ